MEGLVVVEMLRFEVEPDEFDAWAKIDRETWTAFLERQPGFVRKEVWRGEGADVRVVVWWQSQEHWDSITDDQMAEVNAQMGEWLRPSRLESFTLT